MEFESPIALNDITSERILQMKGILAEPGAEPVVTTLPDSLWAIENRLGTRSEMIVLPRTPAVLFVGRYDGPIQPLNKALQAELLDRLKDTEVRV